MKIYNGFDIIIKYSCLALLVRKLQTRQVIFHYNIATLLIFYFSMLKFLGIYLKILENVRADQDLFNSMYSDGTTLSAYNAGSWESVNEWGITARAAMTNAARASLLVEVKFSKIDQSSVIGWKNFIQFKNKFYICTKFVISYV